MKKEVIKSPVKKSKSLMSIGIWPKNEYPERYIGQLIDKKFKDGIGLLEEENKDYTHTYKGLFINDFSTGIVQKTSTYKKDEIHIYEGEMLKSRNHGFGVKRIYRKNADNSNLELIESYKGYWLHDDMQGFAIQDNYLNNCEYLGRFTAGTMAGMGEQKRRKRERNPSIQREFPRRKENGSFY